MALKKVSSMFSGGTDCLSVVDYTVTVTSSSALGNGQGIE